MKVFGCSLLLAICYVSLFVAVVVIASCCFLLLFVGCLLRCVAVVVCC